jgi:hypothetical protein
VADPPIMASVEASKKHGHPIERIGYCQKHLASLARYARDLRNGLEIIGYVLEYGDCGRRCESLIGKWQPLTVADNKKAPLTNALIIGESPSRLHPIR